MSGAGNLIPFENPGKKDRNEERSGLVPTKNILRGPLVEGLGQRKEGIRLLIVYPEREFTAEYSRQIFALREKIGRFEMYGAENFAMAHDILEKHGFDFNLLIAYKSISGLDPLEARYSGKQEKSDEGIGRMLAEIALWRNPCMKAIVEHDSMYELYGFDSRVLLVAKSISENPVTQFQQLVLAGLACTKEKGSRSLEKLLLDYLTDK